MHKMTPFALGLPASTRLVACGGGGAGSAGSMAPSAPAITIQAKPVGTDVLTYKNDLSRTGQNLSESVLTPANVTSAGFGLLRNLAVDGKVDAQPLYVSQLNVSGSLHNVVFAATEHDSVYAFDADTGSALWMGPLLPAPGGRDVCASVGTR